MTDFNKLKVDFSQDGQVLNLTLNAPKGNVLDKEMMSELQKAIERKAAQSSVKAIVLRGEGAHFSFGASVPEHMKENVAEMLATFHDLLRALIATSKPMFALVRGQCLGGGLELAAFCHWIFAAEDAMFGQPEIKLAVFPPVASLVLPHRIGQSAADDLVLTVVDAAAHQFGLLYMGDAPGNDPFGDGQRCVFATEVGVFRFPVRETGPAGTFSEGPGIVRFTHSSLPPEAGIDPGETWHFQGKRFWRGRTPRQYGDPGRGRYSSLRAGR